MLAPTPPDTDVAVMMLELATRAWGHGAEAFIAGLEGLRARGVPLGRFELHLAIHHPLLTGGRLSWEPGLGGRWAVEVDGRWVVEEKAARTAGDNPLYRDGPRAHAGDWRVDGLEPGLRDRLQDPAHPLPSLAGAGLEAAPGALSGAVDFGAPRRSLVLFLPEEGVSFSPAHARALHTFTWGMAATGRGIRWRVLAATLARTYIGPQTGGRVLGGALRRGDVERRRAVVWFSDVRGFTERSSQLEPEAVVAHLNDVFEPLGREISREGGEILKFIGDAVLAIFPYEDEAGEAEASRRALRAARKALATLPPDVRVGVGLHAGELAYGNIGASDRLDFTVIGTTVNTASRVEGMTGKLGVPLLATGPVAAAAPGEWTSAGRFALKGLAGETELFALRQA